MGACAGGVGIYSTTYNACTNPAETQYCLWNGQYQVQECLYSPPSPPAPPPASAIVVHSTQECGAQHTNLGVFATPELCLADADTTNGCGDHIMWSPQYSTYATGWGCRCCTPSGANGGGYHASWQVMAMPSGRRLSAADDGYTPHGRKLLFGAPVVLSAVDQLYYELAHAVGVVEP